MSTTHIQAAFHIKEALELLGIDLQNENFQDTPNRFVKYLQEYLNPGADPKEVLKTGFSHGDAYKGLIVQTDIPFRTVCPHHLLPVVGRAHLGYIPSDRVVGLSKLTRLVECVGTQMPRMQETITDMIADLLTTELEAKGAIVVISAEHGCMFGRGVCSLATPTITSSIRGLLRTEPAAREEFFQLISLSHVK